MEEKVPDRWPPTSEESESRVLTVPMFPLRGVHLFPGSIVPLNIFEPRYRAMVEDLLDAPGRLVLANVVEEDKADMAGNPRVHPVAGLGEIGKHVRLPDGRFLIWLVGMGRVRLREVPSDKLYRRVDVEPLEEVAVPPALRPTLSSELTTAIRERWNGELQLPDELPVEFLADVLVQRMDLPDDVLQEIFAEPVVMRRAERALEEHRERPRSADEPDAEGPTGFDSNPAD